MSGQAYILTTSRWGKSSRRNAKKNSEIKIKNIMVTKFVVSHKSIISNVHLTAVSRSLVEEKSLSSKWNKVVLLYSLFPMSRAVQPLQYAIHDRLYNKRYTLQTI